MPYAVLEKKLQAVPEEYFEQVSSFLDLVLQASRAGKTEEKTEPAKADCRDSYPEGYFDLFGSIDDPTFVEPEEIPWELDAPRKAF